MQVLRNKESEKGNKGRFRVILLVLMWLLIISLGRDLWKLRLGFRRIDEAKMRLAAEEEKNKGLLQEKMDVESVNYKEKLLREKLNMQRPDEIVVVLPDDYKMNSEKTIEVPKKIDSEVNWQKWWNLIK